MLIFESTYNPLKTYFFKESSAMYPPKYDCVINAEYTMGSVTFYAVNHFEMKPSAVSTHKPSFSYFANVMDPARN